MLDVLRVGNKQPKSEVFGQLTIEKRVLITPKSTISIPNIAVISSGTIPASSLLAWTAVMILAGASVVAFAVGDARSGLPLSAAGAVMGLAALVLAIFFTRIRRPCLFISTSDGHTSLFTGQRHTLEEVRRLLSDKINTDDENAVYRINFEKGAIQSVSVGHADSIGAIVAGSGHQVTAAAGSARIASPDTHMLAMKSPGAQLGNGHFSAGHTFHIDYSQVLPQIADMQRFYAQRSDTQDIADRLSEIEHLMRSGTPTPTSRSRLSQLLGDLTAILGAYPGVVQVFQHAARLAGL
jgi:hypothetical protein